MPREGFDSAENRFVKAIAGSLADAYDEVLVASRLRDEDDPAVEAMPQKRVDRAHRRYLTAIKALA